MRDLGEQPDTNPSYNGKGGNNKPKGAFTQGSKSPRNAHVCNRCPHLPRHAVNDCYNASQDEGWKAAIQMFAATYPQQPQQKFNPNQPQITHEQSPY